MAVKPVFPVPDRWTVSTMGEVCALGGGSIQTGPFGSQLHASDYVPMGIPAIMPVNIGDNRIIADSIACIRPEDAQRLERHRVKPGDIVYSRRGDVERRALVREEEDGWLCGTGCLRVRFGNSVVDPLYASYYLSHPDVRAWIVRHAVGATMPNLNTSILSAVPFVVPLPEEQQTIASILGSLDDKIELNRRMNEMLEEIARALFKSWFVDFDPVRAKMEGRQPFGMDDETAALFPDSFEDSPLGEIPKGWRVGNLGDIADNIRRGVDPAAVSPSTPYIGLDHMPRKSIALSEWGEAEQVASGKFEFHWGEVLFGKLRPYFHKVGVAPIDGVCSTDILVVAPRLPLWYGLTLCHLSSVELVNHADATSTGTKMPRAKWSDLALFPITIPSEEVAVKFTESVRPLIDRIQVNIHQSHTLAVIRDTLLPKLLSGEIRVREAEEMVEDAV